MKDGKIQDFKSHKPRSDNPKKKIDYYTGVNCYVPVSKHTSSLVTDTELAATFLRKEDDYPLVCFYILKKKRKRTRKPKERIPPYKGISEVLPLLKSQITVCKYLVYLIKDVYL